MSEIPKWKVGDMARVAVMGGPRWVRVIKELPSDRYEVLSEKGYIDWLGGRALLTLDGCLAHCDYMRDDWTGKEYREAVERCHLPFVAPPKWEEWLARATASQPAHA